jgi:predicted membrane protein
MMAALLRPSNISRKTRRAAFVGGLGYALVLLLTLMWSYGGTNVLDALVSLQIGPFLWWALLGGVVIGIGLAVTVVRYGLISPLLSVVAVYGMTMYLMWQALQSPNPLQPGTPLDIYLISWPLLLIIALSSGLVERRLRNRYSSPEDTEDP